MTTTVHIPAFPPATPAGWPSADRTLAGGPLPTTPRQCPCAGASIPAGAASTSAQASGLPSSLSPLSLAGAVSPAPCPAAVSSHPTHAPAGGTSDSGLRPEQFATGDPLAGAALRDWLRFEEAVYVDGEWRECEGLTVLQACGREVRQALRRV